MSQLIVNGTITGAVMVRDETIPLSGSPYEVTGNIVVPLGITLTIEAGVVFLFHQGISITIAGHLVAIGREDAWINFTSVRSPALPGDWGR